MILAGGRDAWRVADLLAKHKIPVIYEHTFTLPPRDFDRYDIQFRAAGVLNKAGVKVIFSEFSEFPKINFSCQKNMLFSNEFLHRKCYIVRKLEN